MRRLEGYSPHHMPRITYIHQDPDWPGFTWNQSDLAPLLAEVRHEQGLLLGAMRTFGLDTQEQASLTMLTEDAVNTSEIEGEILNRDSVRSSLTRKLGLENAGEVSSSRQVDGLVAVLLDATQKHEAPLSRERLFGWHASLFPSGWSGMNRIRVGEWRNDEKGPMVVVSGKPGREHIHFEAPSQDRLNEEMNSFLTWFNAESHEDPVIRSALVHVYFITIHPFDDGNGRLARALADLQLARADRSALRFYSMSSQIQQEKKAYYDTLEQSQKGSLDVSAWIEWYLRCLLRAINTSRSSLASVLMKATFWHRHGEVEFHVRQRKMINRLLDGFEGKLTSSKWAIICKCSQDTAQRDINDLIARGILEKEAAGGRSTSYRMIHRDLRNGG